MDQIVELARQIGHEKTQSVLVPQYIALLRDPESEVRAIALR